MIKASTSNDLTWGEFAKEFGIGLAVGVATSGIAGAGEAAKILSDTLWQTAIKEAIIGAAVGTSEELIRMGLDSSHPSFSWENVAISIGMSITIGLIKHHARMNEKNIH